MKPWGRFIITLIAYSLALLHTAVPHHHSEPAAGGTTISQAGCRLSHGTSGLLQLVFSTDLGYGHLETFQKSADPDTDFSLTDVAVADLVQLIFKPVTIPEHRELRSAHVEKLHKRLILFSSAQFRAPPALA